MTTQYNYPIRLHNKQLLVYKDPKRFKLLVCGRRFGKSKILRSSVITKALGFNQKIDPSFPPVVVLGMPTLKQATQVHWDSLVGELKNQPFVDRINIADKRIILKGEKPNILLRGLNDQDGDGLRGLKIYYFAGDEWQDVKEAVWELVIRPALGDTPGSSGMFVGTPKGKNHRLYRFYQRIIKPPFTKQWSYYHFITGDNPFFSRSELEEAKATMTPKAYRQEYEAGFEDFDGQIYDQLTQENYLTELPTSTKMYFYIGVDFGSMNPAIVVLGVDFNTYKFYLCDYWLNKNRETVVQGQLFKHIETLCNKWNVRMCYMPDDRKDTCLDARTYGKSKGIKAMERTVIVPRSGMRVMEQNEIINGYIFRREFFILDHLQEVKDQFENYHRAIDSEGQILDEVEEGQEDHVCDGNRYAMISIHRDIREKLKN
jgi:hypothetical protein